jgi:hypothetical protein
MRHLSGPPFREALYFLLLTLASLFSANPYVYGLHNHYVTVPFVWAKAYPGSFPSDPMVAEVQYFYTWFLDGLAWLLLHSGLSIESLFFSLHTLATFLTFAAFFHLARVWSGRRAVAALACLLLLFGTKTIGYVGTLESLLMERTVMLPLEFMALAWMLQKRWVLAFAATGIAFCFHPLSAFYTGAFVGSAGLWHLYTLRAQPGLPKALLHFGLALLAGALAASPGLYLKMSGPSPVMPAGTPVAGWLELMRMRSAYHVFPFTWPLDGWLRAAGFWTAVALVQHGRPSTEKDRLIYATWAAMVLMALAGTVFSEFVPLSLVIQFQFFRAYPFAFMLGMMFLARGLVRAAENKQPWVPVATGLLLALPAWLEMNPFKFLAFVCTCGLLGAVALAGVRLRGWPLLAAVAAPLALVLAMAPVSVSVNGFSLQNQDESNWVAAQHWAREHTPPDAGFIVPPGRRGFRVDSRRSIYVDWNDGTQAFFNQAYGDLWMERMHRAGFSGNDALLEQDYKTLKPTDFESIAREMEFCSQVYAVLYAGSEAPFEEHYSNALYRIVRVR